MFCSNCGQPIGDGKVFCKECGTPAPGASDLDTTDVKPPALRATEIVAPLPPPPPPVSSVSPLPPTVPQVSPPPPPAYGPAWQPPQGPPGRGGRNGLIIGIVAAIVVVAAGGGVGAYFLVRGDDTTKTNVTLVGSSTTTISLTTTAAPSTTTGAASTTTQTVPSLTTRSIVPSRTTVAGETSLNDYLTATDSLVQLLLDDDVRMPELATQINNTAPQVPQSVWDELQSMQGQLDAAFTSLGEIYVPAGFEESDGWLVEATTAMGDRIYSTIQGVEAMWNTNSVSAATQYFDRGRKARDQYRAAFQKFHDTVPID